MKNLFALMALAGLAAFQVGCGGADTTPAKPMTNPPAGVNPMPGSPTMGGTEKKEDGEKKAAAAATEGDKPEGDAADGDKKEEEPKKEE